MSKNEKKNKFSAAAKKAWKTRRENERAAKASAAAKKAWKTRARKLQVTIVY